MHTDSWDDEQRFVQRAAGRTRLRHGRGLGKNPLRREAEHVYAYMREQRDGAFWDRASARGQYEKLRVPGYHIGGWFDGYRNSLPRMLEHVDAPVKAMIGPWDHYFPHDAWPEPRVEWRREAVRWFDHWLKGEDTGILEEPALRGVRARLVRAGPGDSSGCPAAGAGKTAGLWSAPCTRPGTRRRSTGSPPNRTAKPRIASNTKPRPVSRVAARRCGGAASRRTSSRWTTTASSTTARRSSQRSRSSAGRSRSSRCRRACRAPTGYCASPMCRRMGR